MSFVLLLISSREKWRRRLFLSLSDINTWCCQMPNYPPPHLLLPNAEKSLDRPSLLPPSSSQKSQINSPSDSKQKANMLKSEKREEKRRVSFVSASHSSLCCFRCFFNSVVFLPVTLYWHVHAGVQTVSLFPSLLDPRFILYPIAYFYFHMFPGSLPFLFFHVLSCLHKTQILDFIFSVLLQHFFLFFMFPCFLVVWC